MKELITATREYREKLLKDRLENAEKVLEANEEVITKY